MSVDETKELESLFQFLRRGRARHFVTRLWLLIPCGANWRYSGHAVIRSLGDWWLPRWAGIAFHLDAPEVENRIRAASRNRDA